MKDKPLVSVIVPCYNLAAYLPETLDSILAQEYDNWECMIVDDGSTDNTAEVSRGYVSKDFRFNYLYKVNEGVSTARNYGINRSLGKYILPVDADDIIAKEYIAEAVDILENNSEIALIYCDGEFFGKKSGPFELAEYSYEHLLFSNLIFCTAMFRKEDFLKTDGYSTEMNGGLEDWEFWISFLKGDKQVYKISRNYFFYRIRSNSRTSTINENLRMIVYNKHIDTYIRYWGTPFELYRYKKEYLSLKNKNVVKLYASLHGWLYNIKRKVKSLL